MLDLRQIDRDISLADADVKHRGPHLNLECKYLFTLHWLSEVRWVNLLALGDPAVAHGIDEFPTSAWRAAGMRSTVDAWTGVSRGPGGLSRDVEIEVRSLLHVATVRWWRFVQQLIQANFYLSILFKMSLDFVSRATFISSSDTSQLTLNGKMHAQFKPSVSAYSVGIGFKYSLDVKKKGGGGADLWDDPYSILLVALDCERAVKVTQTLDGNEELALMWMWKIFLLNYI